MDSSIIRRYTVPAGILAAMALVLVLLVGGASSTAQAQEGTGPSGETFFALNTSNELLAFDRNNPAQVDARVTIDAGENILGVDFRPATGDLFALGASGAVYIVDPASGAANVTGQVTAPLDGNFFGVDFNPSADALRIVSDNDQNLRIADLDEDFETNVDGTLAYAMDDPNAGVQPNVVATAYSNNLDGVEETEQYVIDSGLGILATQDPPNDGVLNTDGPLGVPATNIVGFDITTLSGADEAFAALQPGEGAVSQLYDVDLSTGAATNPRQIGEGEIVKDLAIPTAVAEEPLPETGGVSFEAVALTGGALLLSAGLAFGLFLRRRAA